jgi:hypothetical protein
VNRGGFWGLSKTVWGSDLSTGSTCRVHSPPLSPSHLYFWKSLQSFFFFSSQVCTLTECPVVKNSHFLTDIASSLQTESRIYQRLLPSLWDEVPSPPASIITMFAPRFEATPVPAMGSKIRPSDLRWHVHEERRIGILRPPPLVIDLTGDDDEDNLQLHNRNNPLNITSHFAALAIRPKVSPNSRPVSSGPSTNPHLSAAQRTHAQATSSRSEPASLRSNKRKESDSGERGNATETWSAKRRLRPGKQVTYAENRVEDMDLDEPAENLIQSIEQDDEDENRKDSDDFDVERVIAQRTGRGMNEYLLGWVGYTELSWIPADDCDCDELIAQFHNVPRFDYPAQSLAGQQLIEQERVRWLERYVGLRADTPERPVRARGLGSFRNPKTGRFERRVEKPSPLSQLSVVIPDSEDEDEEDLVGTVDDVLRNADDHSANIPFPRPSPFDVPHDSGARQSTSPSPQQVDIRQEDRIYDMVSVRQTPGIEETSFPERPAHADQHNQRPRQTAKIFWERETPGAEEEQTSFMHMSSPKTNFLASINPETAKISQQHPAKANRWITVKTKPTQLSSKSPGNESGCTTTTQKTTPFSSASQMCDSGAKSASTWSFVNAAVSTSSETSPASQYSSPCRREAPGLAPANSKAACTAPASSSPKQDAEPTKQPGGVARTSQPRPCENSRRTQTNSSASPRQALKSAAVKPKVSQRSWTSPIRGTGITEVAAMPVGYVQQPLISGSARATQPSASPAPHRKTKSRSPLAVAQAAQSVRSGTARTIQLSWERQLQDAFSKPITGAMQQTMSRIAHPPQSSPGPTVTGDTNSKSSRPEHVLNAQRPFTLGMLQTMSSSFSASASKDSTTASNTLKSLAHVAQPITTAMARKVQDSSERSPTGLSGTKNSLQQQKLPNFLNSPQTSAKKAKRHHGFGVGFVRKPVVNDRKRSTVAAKDLVFKNRGIVRKSSSQSPQRKRQAKELKRGTIAIEAEIASNAGAHGLFKKNVAAVLSSASMNAPRMPAIVPRRALSAGRRQQERSPSVATKAFLALREKEKREREAPTGVRPEVNRDFGPNYPKGLCIVAKSLEASATRRTPPTPPNTYRYCPGMAYGSNLSNDMPMPSIEK